MKTKTRSTAAKRKAQAVPIQSEFHDGKAQAVFIAGTFNDWRPAVTPMIALGDGKWVKELSLPPGRYEYRFVVDGEWTSDPAAAEQASNSYGESNSVLNVPPKPAV